MMQISPGNLHVCYNCGSHNVIGVRSCGNCQATLYYNCPNCQAWVDNTFVNCPGCGRQLNWPSSAYIEDTYITYKSRSHAVLLVVCSVLLLVITFALVENGSNLLKAGSNIPTVEASQPASINNSPDVDTSYQQKPYSPAASPNAATYNYTGSWTISVQDTSSAPEIVITPLTGTSTYVPTGSSYLNSVYPGWGRCSGGRCCGMTQ